MRFLMLQYTSLTDCPDFEDTERKEAPVCLSRHVFLFCEPRLFLARKRKQGPDACLSMVDSRKESQLLLT